MEKVFLPQFDETQNQTLPYIVEIVLSESVKIYKDKVFHLKEHDDVITLKQIAVGN